MPSSVSKENTPLWEPPGFLGEENAFQGPSALSEQGGRVPDIMQGMCLAHKGLLYRMPPLPRDKAGRPGP